MPVLLFQDTAFMIQIDDVVSSIDDFGFAGFVLELHAKESFKRLMLIQLIFNEFYEVLTW